VPAMNAVAEKVLDEAAIMAVLEAIPDPEIPVLTITDLGIVRGFADNPPRVRISPTYTGCPATAVIAGDVEAALQAAGVGLVRVRTVLSPAWTTDWISESGKAKLAAAGISPPGAAPRRASGPVPLVLGLRGESIACPRCGCAETERISAFGATACRELRRCPACREPFEHLKEI